MIGICCYCYRVEGSVKRLQEHCFYVSPRPFSNQNKKSHLYILIEDLDIDFNKYLRGYYGRS